MLSDPDGVVHGFYRAMMADDQAGQLAYFAENATFHQHIPDGIVGHSGITFGKAQMAERLVYIYTHWDVVEVEPVYVQADGEIVNAQMRFVFRFKRSGDLLDGGIRHVFRITGGRIVRLDEYMDAAVLRAFLTMAAAHGAPQS